MRPSAIDRTPVEGGCHCNSCGRTKPLHQFSPSQVRAKWRLCRTCNRLAVAAYRETPKGKAWQAQYTKRPEVVERVRLAGQAQKARPDYRARRREYEQSERGLIVHRINNVRYRLKRADTAEKRKRLEALMKRHQEDLAMLDEELNG